MEAAAHSLPALPPYSGDPVELHLLSGKCFWYQTAFCLWSFSHSAEHTIIPVIYDDGSLAPEQSGVLKRLFPRLRLVPQCDSLIRLDRYLPASRFPVLRERWRNYPNIRKLIDPHLGSTGYKLVLDSDLLFFRRPDFLLKWLVYPDRPLHAVDCETSYGYSRPLLEELAGAPLQDRVNVGLTGLNSSSIDWERLEFWCQSLISRERTSYYLEQALIAMLLAGQECAVAPVRDYITKPERAEAEGCRAVMHHYVAGSKCWYFQQNWRHTISQQTR